MWQNMPPSGYHTINKSRKNNTIFKIFVKLANLEFLVALPAPKSVRIQKGKYKKTKRKCNPQIRLKRLKLK